MVANLEIIKTVSIVAQPSKKYEDFRGKSIASVAPVRVWEDWDKNWLPFFKLYFSSLLCGLQSSAILWPSIETGLFAL